MVFPWPHIHIWQMSFFFLKKNPIWPKCYSKSYHMSFFCCPMQNCGQISFIIFWPHTANFISKNQEIKKDPKWNLNSLWMPLFGIIYLLTFRIILKINFGSQKISKFWRHNCKLTQCSEYSLSIAVKINKKFQSCLY